MSKIVLSDHSLQLVKSVYDSLREKHVTTQFDRLQDSWVEQYNIIKAEEWPLCQTYEDFSKLSDEIKKECIEVHNFSPEIYYKAIVDEFNTRYEIKESIDLFELTESFLTSHLEILKEKKVIDLACNFGQWSLFCCNHQSLDVVGVDVREESIEIAKSIQQDFDVNTVKFLKEDIHNYYQIEKLCADRDTVLLLGIMYHVHDHLEILKAVCQPNVSYVVIETGDDPSTVDVTEPLVWWKEEITADLVGGFYKGNETILVGYPNSAWFDLVMLSLNFKRTDSDRSFIYYSINKTEKYKQHRSIYLYEKIK